MDCEETRWEDVDWIHMAEDWDRWQVVVNMV
jgi:hypothetical protein